MLLWQKISAQNLIDVFIKPWALYFLFVKHPHCIKSQNACLDSIMSSHGLLWIYDPIMFVDNRIQDTSKQGCKWSLEYRYVYLCSRWRRSKCPAQLTHSVSLLGSEIALSLCDLHVANSASGKLNRIQCTGCTASTKGTISDTVFASCSMIPKAFCYQSVMKNQHQIGLENDSPHFPILDIIIAVTNGI